MNILLVTEVIYPGGAETFLLRLSKALQKSGHNVHIFIFYSENFNDGLYNAFAPNVPLTTAEIPASWLLAKVDSALFKLKIDYSLRGVFIKRSLKKLLEQINPSVIHSHLLKTDAMCLEITEGTDIPVVTTIHGDYLQFYNKTQAHIRIPLLHYAEKALNNLQKLQQVICISDKQLNFFQQHFDEATKGKLSKIYNGYDGKPSNNASTLKKIFDIGPDDFVFGMVSRGIADKGWQIAIDAFLQLNKPNTRLVLVGESDYLRSLSNVYAQHKNIHFTGHTDKPLDWIQVMDAGLLPTTYMSESLPTVIIEYMCCGVPAIASDAGEIENMLCAGDKVAGIITPIRNNAVDITEVKNAMERYVTDRALYLEHKANAALCYEHFDMQKCVDAYCRIYQKAIDNRNQKSN